MPALICVFEDTHYEQLLPLVYTRPVYKLRCGISSLQEKIARRYPKAPISLHCRPYLAECWQLRNPKTQYNEISGNECLLINGRVIAHAGFEKLVPLKSTGDIVYVNGDSIVAVHLSGENLKRLQSQVHRPLSVADFDWVPKREVEAEMVSYPWDVVHRNGKEIERDFSDMTKGRKGKSIKGKIHKSAQLLNKSNIFIDEGTIVKPNVVIDAEEGPVYIGKNVKIFPQATLIGPLSIGDGSWIKAGAQIYENTSIGPKCKIGGEVEASIFHGYSNKQHSGFIGHSYIGAWVNLGADTNNSDLKNNYSNVKVQIGTEQIDTGLQFVGLTMGDHSKSSINSMFNTGAVVGVSSNVFGNDFPPKYVPSFSWGAATESASTYNVDRAIDVARRVMARRKVEMTSAEEKLFKAIFDMTSPERKRRGMQG
ncbi:MAG: GlmU family protein [Ignavibacteriae bacterium]|nr:GlmU family protein [Ignavibacteriota bacterium]